MNSSFVSRIRYQLFTAKNPVYIYIALNLAVFLILLLLGSISPLFSVYLWLPASMPAFFERPYTWLTYMFVHHNFFTLLYNMLLLYWSGTLFLQYMGKRAFHTIYLFGGLVGGLFFVLAYSLFPRISPGVPFLFGAQAAVMAILAAIATLLPQYSIRLLLFGSVKLSHIAIVVLVLNAFSLGSTVNGGMGVAQLAGALLGFAYVRWFVQGRGFSSPTVKRGGFKVHSGSAPVTQAQVDAVLDKISARGYKSLSQRDKQVLHNFNKQK